jgi:hypothetical protein
VQEGIREMAGNGVPEYLGNKTKTRAVPRKREMKHTQEERNETLCYDI